MTGEALPCSALVDLRLICVDRQSAASEPDRRSNPVHVQQSHRKTRWNADQNIDDVVVELSVGEANVAQDQQLLRAGFRQELPPEAFRIEVILIERRERHRQHPGLIVLGTL